MNEGTCACVRACVLVSGGLLGAVRPVRSRGLGSLRGGSLLLQVLPQCHRGKHQLTGAAPPNKHTQEHKQLKQKQQQRRDIDLFLFDWVKWRHGEVKLHTA